MQHTDFVFGQMHSEMRTSLQADTDIVTTSMTFMRRSRSGHEWIQPLTSCAPGCILARHVQQLSVIPLCIYYGSQLSADVILLAISIS